MTLAAHLHTSGDGQEDCLDCLRAALARMTAAQEMDRVKKLEAVLDAARHRNKGAEGKCTGSPCLCGFDALRDALSQYDKEVNP